MCFLSISISKEQKKWSYVLDHFVSDGGVCMRVRVGARFYATHGFVGANH